MDLDPSIGQLFMVDFTGHTPAPDVIQLIERDGIGGVILFAKNIASARQVATLTNALQEIASQAGRPPLLVSADQEGGSVVRLPQEATHFPSAMAFGAAASEALAASAAGVTARELRAVGIQMNMAPDLDVNSNPANPVIGVRSFGEDPRRTARLGIAVIRAMQASGVLATAKHFPGHGDTSTDSHLELPVVSHPRAHLDRIELPPFAAAVRAGVGAVMTAHVVYPALDPERPATLSPTILRMLREQLGFAGLIVTDSMAMRAITDREAPGEAAVQAILAGVDIVLACGPAEAQREAIDAVRHAVAAGRISAPRIEQAAARVAAAKCRLTLTENARVRLDDLDATVGIPAHRDVAEHVAEAAVTLVRSGRSAIPLPPGPVAVVSLAGASPGTDERVAAALRDAGRDAAAIPADCAGAMRGGPLVVVVGPDIAAGAGGDPASIVRQALVAGPVAAVSIGVPYGLARLPRDVGCIAAYGCDPPSLRAAARVLAGRLQARGRLPVTLPEPHEAGPEAIGEA